MTRFRAYHPEKGRWLSADPIGFAGGRNLYGYVGGNVVNTVDSLGLSAIHVNFEDYLVNFGFGFYYPAGHAGVVTANDVSGKVRYFEFGRYGGKYGDVREIEIKNFTIDFVEYGIPAQSSLDRLANLLSISKIGKGSNATLAYFSDANESKILEFVMERKNNPEKYPYRINPGFDRQPLNTCKNFAWDAIAAGRAK